MKRILLPILCLITFSQKAAERNPSERETLSIPKIAIPKRNSTDKASDFPVRRPSSPKLKTPESPLVRTRRLSGGKFTEDKYPSSVEIAQLPKLPEEPRGRSGSK